MKENNIFMKLFVYFKNLIQNKIFKGIIKTIFVLFVILSIIFLYDYSRRTRRGMERGFDYLAEKVSVIENWGDINLTQKTFQNINESFLVSINKVERHLTGIRVYGIMLNKSSINLRDVNFVIEVANQRQTFTTNFLIPKMSKEFEVYIPDVPLDNMRNAKITYQGSMISYK